MAGLHTGQAAHRTNTWLYSKTHMPASWQEMLLHKMWWAAGRIPGLYSDLCTGDWKFLPISCSFPPSWGKDKLSPPDLQLTEHWGHRNCQRHQENQPWTIISQAAPTWICQTLGLKAQLSGQSLHHPWFQRFSEADLCACSIFLPPSVLQNLQANPGSFPLEMHFLQM